MEDFLKEYWLWIVVAIAAVPFLWRAGGFMAGIVQLAILAFLSAIVVGFAAMADFVTGWNRRGRSRR